MSKLSKIRIEDLKRLRRYLLFRYADTDCKSSIHARIGAEIDKVSLELNLRLGETKYKL